MDSPQVQHPVVGKLLPHVLGATSYISSISGGFSLLGCESNPTLCFLDNVSYVRTKWTRMPRLKWWYTTENYRLQKYSKENLKIRVRKSNIHIQRSYLPKRISLKENLTFWNTERKNPKICRYMRGQGIRVRRI